MKIKIRIGIDLDDTIWKFHEYFFEFYNDKYGTNHSIENYNIYDMENFLGKTREEIFPLWGEYESLEKYRFLPLLDNVKESVLKLSEEFDIYFITAKSIISKNLVNERILKIFGRKFPVEFIRDENGRSLYDKFEICIRENIEFMIDDSYYNLRGCAENGIRGILINYPWNINEELHENIQRVDNWKEIMEILKNEL